MMKDQISVRLVVPSANGDDDDDAPGPLLTALREEDGEFDFSMTNPPFFESTEEVSGRDERAYCKQNQNSTQNVDKRVSVREERGRWERSSDILLEGLTSP